MINHSKEFEELLSIKGLPGYIKAASLPDIELYMDQVTTFMDEHLNEAKRYSDDKILTKTMINNYTKNKLLPPSEKKKYSQGHLILLIYIYYLKNVLSINDIQTLLEPMIENHFSSDSDLTMKDIYRGIVRTETGLIRPFMDDIRKKIAIAEDVFPEAEGEDREYIQVFTMICMLIFDVYLKKQMVERMIDHMREEKGASNPKNKDKE
ncbi:MAG: DUF1836 domain-containing protein [Lachnospiraceae bacterium]|nr:DUF1836 domain-containing protein [Lachnospiraceae bacterium]